MSMAKKGFTVHIDEQIIDDFRTYCNLNALKVSAKVELLLKKEIKNAKINPTLIEMFHKVLKGEKILRTQKSREQTKVIEDSTKIKSKTVPTIEHLKKMKEI